MSNLSNYGLGLLRIVTAYLFLLHGTSKFFDFPIPPHGGSDSVELFSPVGIAGIIEIIGGVLLIIGLFTRSTAFILSGMMAYAYFFIYVPRDVSLVLYPLANRGESAALFCFISFYLFLAGPGAFALDKLCKKNR